MKPAVLASFALLFASAAVAAQTAGQQPSQVTVLRLPPIGIGCPLSFRAQHGASGDIFKVDNNRPAGVAQLLHLILVNPDSRQIVAARFRVRGLSGKARVTQTHAGQDDADVTRSLQLKFSDGAGKEVSGDLWVPGMTAVLSIDLESVTFSDGSTRTFAAHDACRVAPDLKMLIGSR